MVKSLDFRIGTLLLRVAAIEKLGYLNYTRNVPNTFFWIFITATHSSFFFYSFINHSTLTLRLCKRHIIVTSKTNVTNVIAPFHGWFSTDKATEALQEDI